jgi:hypothetical protein
MSSRDSEGMHEDEELTVEEEQQALHDLQDGYPESWGPSNRTSSDAAKAHAETLEHPPSFDKVKHLLNEAPNYPELPRPVPSRGRSDALYARLESKLAASMQYYVHGLNEPEPDPDTFIAVVALVRSAFQDIREERRRKVVGSARTVLETRPDDTRAKLLTDAEQKKLEKQRQVTASATNTFRSFRDQASKGGYNRQPRGKGKGKGKGQSGRFRSSSAPPRRSK